MIPWPRSATAKFSNSKLLGVRSDSRTYTAPITNRFPTNDSVDTISMTVNVTISPPDMVVESVGTAIVVVDALAFSSEDVIRFQN